MKKQKKVAIYIASMRGGGAERVMLILAKCFARQGLAVDLVLVSAEGPYLKELPSNIKVINLNASRVFFSILGLTSYIREMKPDVLLSAMSHVNIVAIIARAFARKPLRLVVSERSHLSSYSKDSGCLRGRLIPIFVKFFYKWADKIVVVSKGVKEDLLKYTDLSEDSIEIIYNPVLIEEILIKADAFLKHPWINDENTPVILGVGRLSKEKNFDILIQACAIVSEKLPLKLIILGEGLERENLVDLIKTLGVDKDVSLQGFVENPYTYMSKSSLLVLSSSWEGLPNVLLEAMVCGCPVVSTDCYSGPSEILENGKYGPLVPVGDVSAMAEAIYNVLLDPPNPELLRNRASLFSAEIISNKYIEMMLLS